MQTIPVSMYCFPELLPAMTPAELRDGLRRLLGALEGRTLAGLTERERLAVAALQTRVILARLEQGRTGTHAHERA